MKKSIISIAIVMVLAMALAIFTPVFAAWDDSYIEYETLLGVPDTGIMDFSWLNEMPAGQHGFVQVVDGDFQFEDGTPVRFWGSTCGFGGAIMEKSAAEKVAEDLASMGVNMIRIHAIDCIWGGNSSGIVDFSTYKNGAGTGPIGFHEQSIDRMDYLIYCLKEKGIYIHLDTSAGRRITIGEGFIADEVTISKNYNLRGASFFDQRVSDIEYDYAKDLMEHVNPYTGIAYCDEPAIAIVQRVNESSSLWVDWGGAGNAQNGFTNTLNARFNEWLVEKYGTREALAQAWTNDKGRCGLKDSEDPTQGTVISGLLGNWSEPNYMSNMASPNSQNHCRHVDWIDFLNQLQRDDFQKFYDMLRDLGYGGSINCSNIMAGPVDLSNNFLGDVTEMNWYFESTNQSLSEQGMLDLGSLHSHLVPKFTTASATDKALVVTEWRSEYQNNFRADAAVTIAAYASLQGWDGMLMWIYTDKANSSGIFTNNVITTDTPSDPAWFGQMGLAAMIFRLGYIQEAENEVEYVFTRNDVLANNGGTFGVTTPLSFISKISHNYIDEVYEGDADLVFASGNTASGDYSKANKLVISNTLPYADGFKKVNIGEEWLSQYIEDDAVEKSFGTRIFKVGTKTAVLNGANNYANTYAFDTQFFNDVMREFGLWGDDVGYIDGKAISDTKELVFDYKNGFLTCSTDKTCFITGRIPSSEQVGSIKYTTTNDKATIALISTDNKKITESDSLYLYTCGRTRNATAAEDETGKVISLGSGPVFIQDIRGTFFFESEKDICNVWGLDSNGKRVEKLDVTAKDGGFEFALGNYVNYEIRTTADAPESSAPESSAPESSAPESSAPETSAPETSAPESSTSQNSQSGSNGNGGGSPVIWIVIAVAVVVAVVVVVLLSKKKK